MTSPRQPSTRTRREVVASICRSATESRWFTTGVCWLILANAVVLGVETYPAAVEAGQVRIKAAEYTFFTAFTIEAAVRAGAHAERPSGYFRSPWNLFDLTLLVLIGLPFLSENATALRLLRLGRVLRAARMLPQLRIIFVAIGRSIPGAMAFVLAGALLLYMYAMFGWMFFAERDPEHYGTLGRAILNLFLLATLDGLSDAVRAGLAISPWSILYYASYVLLTSFVLVNVLIGVVINSLEEARRLETPGAAGETAGKERQLREYLVQARGALDDLEYTIAGPPPPQGERTEPSRDTSP
ncbi:ion transporter [Streptomyces sp. 4F14]|uniref:ion transporter n=1 Tax=Streptomyces sp. 4F14 TaxID=3394380 RepID=UPI003A8AE104